MTQLGKDGAEKQKINLSRLRKAEGEPKDYNVTFPQRCVKMASDLPSFIPQI